jgi:hypothetical protein
LIYLGFLNERKLAAIFIKPSLGVSNWPVIYIINYTPTSFLAPFNTAPSLVQSKALDEAPYKLSGVVAKLAVITF